MRQLNVLRETIAYKNTKIKYQYIYIYIYIYIYMQICINLPVNATVRLLLPWNEDSQGQETFLAPSADMQTRNYNIECSNYHPSLSTIRPKGLKCSKINWWAIYTNLQVNAIVRLPHPWSGDNQGQETFLAPSVDKQIRIDNILNNPSKFKPRNWFQANDDIGTKYSTNSEI